MSIKVYCIYVMVNKKPLYNYIKENYNLLLQRKYSLRVRFKKSLGCKKIFSDDVQF